VAEHQHQRHPAVTTALDRRTFAAVSARARKRREPPKTAVQWAADHGIHWWSAQRAIAESVERHKRTAVRAAHGVGKSYTAAGLAAWWVDTHPDSLVVSSAPSAHQVHGILWHEIRGLHGALKLPGRVLDNDEWKVGARQVAFGRKPPDEAKGSDFDPSVFQGYHRAGGVLVILDEAGGLPGWLWEAAENITTTDNSRILAIGNPDNPGSEFARVSRPGAAGWSQLRIAAADSPNFTDEDVPRSAKAALVTRQWAADMLSKWGADDRHYVSKVLAEFPGDRADQVIPTAALDECFFAEPRGASELLPVALGVDVGGGSDLTVVRERRGVRAGRRWAVRDNDPEVAARLVVRAVQESGATSVNVDANGVGWALCGLVRVGLRAAGLGAKVNPVMVGEASSQPKVYANLKAEIWWVIGREGSQKREWDLSQMAEPGKVREELLMPRYLEDAKRRILIEPKDDIRARTGGESPDDADALLLAYYVARDAQGSYWEALQGGKLRLWTLRSHGWTARGSPTPT
jgi:hypothetical protein